MSIVFILVSAGAIAVAITVARLLVDEWSQPRDDNSPDSGNDPFDQD